MRKILIFLFLLSCVGVVSADYIIPIEATTVSPLDAQTTYFGWAPFAPNTSTLNTSVYVPSSGTITHVELYEYAGTAGSNEVYQYFIRVNDTTDYRIANLSVSANERVWTNTSMGVSVSKGNFIQIKRIQPTWNPNPATDIVGGYVYVNTSEYGYTLPAHSISSSPADGNSNSFGLKPIAVETTAGRNKIYIPQEGNITWAYAMSFSSIIAGSNEAHTTYLNISGASPGITIGSQAVTTPVRLFHNGSINNNVQTTNYIEFFRRNPTWNPNPTGEVIGALVWINTSITRGLRGTAYPVQALTSSPGDNAIVYFGNLPKAPTTTANISKIYFRMAGNITRAAINVYSGTAGTNENWNLSIRKNNAVDYRIENIAGAANERIFNNESLDIPIVSGDYIEIKGMQPAWATNPATTIYGGYVWLEYESRAAFTSNTTSGNTPLPVLFTDMSTNAPTAWNWSYNNVTGNNTEVWWSTSQNPTIAFGVGNWSIKLNVTNGDGYNITPGMYWVNASTITLAPVSSFTPNVTSGNIPLVVQFNDTSTGSPTTWNWSFGDGNWTNGTTRNVTKIYESAGNFPSFLISSNAGGANQSGTQYIFASNVTVGMLVVPVIGDNSDARLRREDVNAAFTSVRSGIGTVIVNNTGAITGAGFIAGTSANTYNSFTRFGWCGNATSAGLPAGSTITSGYFSVYAESSASAMGLGNISIGIGEFHPTNPLVLSMDDYNKTDSVRYSTDKRWSAGWSADGWNNYTLNAAGLANVSTTGTTCIMLMAKGDIDNSTSEITSWNSGGYSIVKTYDSNQTGTSKDPILTLDYTTSGEAPVASFTVNKNMVRIPNTIECTDTSTNTPTSWSWDWGDGTSQTTGTPQPSHTYTKRGKFDIVLTATNDGGSDASDATSIRVTGYENYY